MSAQRYHWVARATLNVKRKSPKIPISTITFFLFFSPSFACLKTQFLKFLAWNCCGFWSRILIAETERKIKTQISGNCFWAQKKVSGRLVLKSNFQLTETTLMVEIRCRLTLWLFFGGATVITAHKRSLLVLTCFYSIFTNKFYLSGNNSVRWLRNVACARDVMQDQLAQRKLNYFLRCRKFKFLCFANS